ncbi:MAG TPA: hypothetical protein VFL19_03205 [Nitrospira sp.]|nr:hypothetical protein [Nitrospira sp.]
MAPLRFTVTAEPLEFGKGVLSGTIGELDMLALAKSVMLPTIKAKCASQSAPRLDLINDFSIGQFIRHRR